MDMEGGTISMHTTPYGVLLVGLVLCVTPLAEGADSALDRATLRGLTGVRVLVAPLEPEVEREGLTKNQMQTDV